MNIAPKVSIDIPAYNREKYLGMAVRSVLDQTYRDFELIIVDDGSTDATLEIAQQFAREDDRVRVLTDKVNRGAAYALKTGFAAARGEYVGQVDSDDLLEALAVEKTAAVLDENPDCGMAYTNYVEIDENGKKTRVGWRCSRHYSKEDLLTTFMTFHFRLIRRSIYEQAGGIDLKFNMLEDYDLCLRISEITIIINIPEFLYCYRNHPEGVFNKNRLKVALLAKDGIEAALKRRGMEKTHEVFMKVNPEYVIRQIKSKQHKD
ncbi:MAG TPA: glycosyltransferase [Kamptonema sp.]|nr:glycosyltransferase [Kamptonema sp.]